MIFFYGMTPQDEVNFIQEIQALDTATKKVQKAFAAYTVAVDANRDRKQANLLRERLARYAAQA